MIARRRVAFSIPLIALIGLLAGCAAPVSSPTSSPTHATPAHTGVTTASRPGSRVPLGCEDLLGADAVSAIAGDAPHLYHDQNTAPTTITDIAQQQYGALDCDWFHEDSGATGAELQVSVAPDAKSAFTSRFDAIMADQSLNPHPAATENIAGDQSGFWCANDVEGLGADATLPICDGELLVAGYWVSVEVDTDSGVPRSQLVEAVPNVLKQIATRLTATGAAPGKWVAPATTPPAFCSAASSTAAVRTVFADPTLVPTPAYSYKTTASTIGLVGPHAACNWDSSTSQDLYVRLLAGGSWAFPAFTPSPTGDAGFRASDYSALSVAGAKSVKEACVNGACDAFLAVGSTAVQVTYNDPGAAKRASVLAAFVTALAAS